MWGKGGVVSSWSGLLGGLLFGVVDHLGVAGRLRQVGRWHRQVHPGGAGDDEHGLGEREEEYDDDTQCWGSGLVGGGELCPAAFLLPLLTLPR